MQRIVHRSLRFVTATLLFAGITGCGSSSPDWTFRDAGGDVRAMSDYRGGVTLLAFTNSWCDSCHHAAMHLQDIQERFADQGVRVVFVSSWERGDASAYLNEQGYTYGLMLNGTEIAREYDIDKIPTFCLLGPDGKVVARHEGFKKGTPEKIASSIERHLRKTGQYTAQYDD